MTFIRKADHEARVRRVAPSSPDPKEVKAHSIKAAEDNLSLAEEKILKSFREGASGTSLSFGSNITARDGHLGHIADNSGVDNKVMVEKLVELLEAKGVQCTLHGTNTPVKSGFSVSFEGQQLASIVSPELRYAPRRVAPPSRDATHHERDEARRDMRVKHYLRAALCFILLSLSILFLVMEIDRAEELKEPISEAGFSGTFPLMIILLIAAACVLVYDHWKLKRDERDLNRRFPH